MYFILKYFTLPSLMFRGTETIRNIRNWVKRNLKLAKIHLWFISVHSLPYIVDLFIFSMFMLIGSGQWSNLKFFVCHKIIILNVSPCFMYCFKDVNLRLYYNGIKCCLKKQNKIYMEMTFL